MRPYADLHIHSTHSDGTMTPAEIVAAAIRADVGLLAVTDHEILTGAREIIPLCRDAGIDCIFGVELDSLLDARDFHILGYGCDDTDAAFLSLVQENRRTLDGMSDALLTRMAPRESRISQRDFSTYERDVSRGGWKFLDYLLSRGVIHSAQEGFTLYDEYGITYAEAGFPAAEDVIARIHAAGGLAVIAHPGVSAAGLDADAMIALLRRLLAAGADGIECHYPKHSPAITARCLALAEQTGCLVTAGSDCHGSFSGAPIGGMRILRRQLRLDGLKILCA